MTNQQAAIGRIAKFINGMAFKPSDWELEGRRIIRIQNLTDPTKPYNYTSKRVNEKFVVAPNDILVSWSASLGVYRWTEQESAVLNQHIFKVIPDHSKVNDGYFYYVLAEAIERMKMYLHGSTMQHVNRQEFLDTRIPLPPLAEQQRIADILSRADRLRRLRRFALEMSEGYLQAVFLEMFGDPVTNPMGWEVRTLSQLKAKFTYGTSAKCDSAPIGLPVLRIPNILNREINTEDLKYAKLSDKEVKQLELQRGDIVFVRTNGNPDYVGRCAVFQLSERFLFASYLIRARFNDEKINPWYLDTYLRSESGRFAMSPYIRTTAGQSNIGMEGLGQIPVPLPPEDLQQRFAGIVTKYERLRAQQREALRQAEHLFQGLLQAAFRGEV